MIGITRASREVVVKKQRRLTRAATGLALVALASALAACGGDGGDDAGATSGGGLQVLIASSGDAETNSVRTAAQAWSTESGTPVEVLPAQDIQQQLGQGFAGGNPPDVFYVDAAKFGDYAKQGSLYAYGDQLDNADAFYPSLVSTFTYDGKFYCAPKDFSTLALVINTDLWSAAGLAEADVPTTWDELTQVATTLTTGGVTGLVVGDTRDRVGAFMRQAGGWFVNADGTQATVDSPENAQALDYVKGLLADNVAAYPKALGAGWGGEAFGLGKAAMAVEGNWIKGAVANDYPDIEYLVAEMPAGPAGKGTLLFTQCWGIAEQSDNKEQALALVQALTTEEAQQQAAEDFGVMPSLQSLGEWYAQTYPEDAAFVAGGDYGQGPVTVPGFAPVLAEFDTQLQGLATANVEQILQATQTNAEAVVGAAG
jgi:multiple sugar transport system substrate-binding protein